MEENNERIETVWFSDEMHFHLSGVVNSHTAMILQNQKTVSNVINYLCKATNQQMRNTVNFRTVCSFKAKLK